MKLVFLFRRETCNIFPPAPNEIFCATAYEEGGPQTRGHSDGEMFVFPVEIVDHLDSYNNVTGNKKAVWFMCKKNILIISIYFLIIKNTTKSKRIILH